MQSRYRFYGLLYLDAATSGGVNLSRGANPVDTYLRCAATCHASFARQGEAFALITNDPNLVRGRLAELGCAPIEVVEIPFRPVVPRNTRFYAAHFKLDVLDAFARGDLGSHVGLVDIDCVLQRPLVLSDALSVYEISEQVYPAHGMDRVRRDLEEVAGIAIEVPRWFGGEFIAGPREQFGLLKTGIDACLPRYVARLDALHHLGDEMVVSAAIHRAMREGLTVDDLGESAQIVRWWSSKTYHRQVSLTDAAACAILHLPSDKSFLADRVGKAADMTQFLRDYETMFRRKRRTLQASRVLDRVLRRPDRLVAEI
ncbi:hypothetical protein [Methylobacterium sp. J-068]|uniref:hypothetical protein n=1 Tax=Methylobacterium sp. J-068 TaxID=2836649 RepID=UPI001FBAB951|nr:hypothetical protein [Methylobacterium sp. J-068]MCJ2033490.1 hypothetical protein [Methylobacterium sp. J-068]